MSSGEITTSTAMPFAREVRRGANAADLLGGLEQGMGDAAGHHVDLIALRHGDDHVGILSAGELEYVWVRRLAGDHADVDVVFELTQALGVGVDDGNVVRLAR
jgi:hypothetical protein